MRIIGGQLRGRRFQPPANKWPTRPTTDFAREGLYNILYHRMNFEGIEALDLFGGFGGHTFELVSRGCQAVTYVDKHRGCARFVESTAQQLDIKNAISIVNRDVFAYLKTCSSTFDFIFADPPYAMLRLPDLPDLIRSKALLRQGGLFVLEHAKSQVFEQADEQRSYGDSAFSFFSFEQ